MHHYPGNCQAFFFACSIMNNRGNSDMERDQCKNSTQGCTGVNGWSCTVGLEPKISSNSNSSCCSCTNCKFVIKHTSHWTKKQKEDVDVAIKLGDRVIVKGRFTGTVKYIGDLDSNYINDQVYIGVKLDEPVGETDGMYRGKRFFKCPESHGVIVPIYYVHVLVPRDGRKFTAKARTTKYRSRPFFSQEKGLYCDGYSPEAHNTTHRENSKEHLCANTKLARKAENTIVEMGPTAANDTITKSLGKTPIIRPHSQEKVTKSDSAEVCVKKAISEKVLSLPKLQHDDITEKLPEKKDVTSVLASANTTNFHPIGAVTTASKLCQTSNINVKDELTHTPAKENLNTAGSYSRAFLSGLKTDYGAPHSFSSSIVAMENLKKMVEVWGGGEKGFRMAFTLQKLQAAKLKGMKELEWQKELLEMDQDAEFATRREELRSLKEEIVLMRKKVANVNAQIEQKESLKRPSAQDEISDLKLRIEKLSKKNANSFKDLFQHPMAINGGGIYVKETIARITKEFRVKRKNLSAPPQCGLTAF